MTSTLTFAPKAVQQQIFRIVRELCLELLDVVDILLDLEHCFAIYILDKVPFFTVGDLVDYVTAKMQRRLRV